ncbi:uncharacterized protein EI97DRAFT_437200 [Westerdykella ornata]|uniref:Glycoside hydrolase family 125 protein n=1 Tax=Westerdykella ornata TaxID=318751 RepID=A0A6A6J6A3_WESOR|nr:uncharacterized protein EI97DRAFT_437200 [Westerdykella ornata]KAF2272110.1 hypothetical protein EI97DRAFT_437200 [Westerdykella ornata]
MGLQRVNQFLAWASLSLLVSAQCPLYQNYANKRHEPLSSGRYNLSYARPVPDCRTFHSPELEDTLKRLKDVITDPDLYRLFENTWPSTLDTTIAWRGYAAPPSLPEEVEGAEGGEGVTKRDAEEKEELSFIITGDIEAMWLRDSANQLQAYTSILKPSTDFSSLASVFRGAINLQARYILEAPFCNAFQAPVESNITRKSSENSDRISPSFDFMKVFSCQWELDSVASFLQLSDDYVTATGDYEFFSKWKWKEAVKKVLETAESMMIDSYNEAGEWQHTPYTYCAPYGGTPINDCNGSPHRNIGLIRSFHRPSDDACTYQFLIPSNMMFSHALNTTAKIMSRIEGPDNANLTNWMRTLSTGIRTAIHRHARVADRTYGTIFAYEIDGYGSANIMDDPNIPSLLSAPFIGYLDSDDPVYQNTRRKILSKDNPYFSWGPVITGVGSPHTLPGRAWPMASIMRILTSDDDEEITETLRQLVGSTDGLGLMHESVSSHSESQWSRQW